MKDKVTDKTIFVVINTHFTFWLFPLQHASWDPYTSLSRYMLWTKTGSLQTLMQTSFYINEPNMKVNLDTVNHKHAIEWVHGGIRKILITNGVKKKLKPTNQRQALHRDREKIHQHIHTVTHRQTEQNRRQNTKHECNRITAVLYLLQGFSNAEHVHDVSWLYLVFVCILLILWPHMA